MGCKHSRTVIEDTHPTKTLPSPTPQSNTNTLSDNIISDMIPHKRVTDISLSLNIHELIGKGHFGCVRRAVNIHSGKEYAIKIVNSSNSTDTLALTNEINILKHLHHPQIVRVLGSFEDATHLYMLMQFCKGESLYSHLYQKKRKFSEQEIREILCSLLRALAFLHSNTIIHRDLKLENVLLERNESCNSLKVCDFGLSTLCKRGETLNKSLGTIDYIAPEVLDGEYTNKCDLWSAGVICYELMSGVSPFHAETTDATIQNIYNGTLVFDDRIWRHYSPSAIQFIKSLVHENAETRLSAEEALEHIWILNRDKKQESVFLMKEKRVLIDQMVGFKQFERMKQTALLSVALGVSEENVQRELVARLFYTIDLNKNGHICENEFCMAMEESGMTKKDARNLFMDINQSKSGKINFIEFLAACMDQEAIGQCTLREAFNVLDQDGSGKISIMGLQSVFQKSMKMEDVKDIIQSVHGNENGTVNFEQFQELFRKGNGR